MAGAVTAPSAGRLDGLTAGPPEPRCARLRLLSPGALLERLDRALDVLTSGPRDSPERHQTLRATIELEPLAPQLRGAAPVPARGRSVFAGGWTLADLEAVCADPGETHARRVGVARRQGPPCRSTGTGDRFRMLETIRQYASGAARGRRRDWRSGTKARPPVRGSCPGEDPRRYGRRPSGHIARTRPYAGGGQPLQARAGHAPGIGRGDGKADAGEQGMPACAALSVLRNWHSNASGLERISYSAFPVSPAIPPLAVPRRCQERVQRAWEVALTRRWRVRADVT